MGCENNVFLTGKRFPGGDVDESAPFYIPFVGVMNKEAHRWHGFSQKGLLICVNLRNP
ncbi:hypothetical protein NIASO_10045 [Niabella soli DSM 19437]|uniref:Uncharacterized protein n=1 Tax=Niabella soli DSM 19437 TaxID=929713 RepID=W0F3G5_9BACT|nr:hypothetical protein NIASO_10045 [Niabella soli DSM 19437]